MVYCGKPSKGCEACRARKTKCDLARPSCGQCLRTRRICGGYRNELDLSFRNESATVIRKAKLRSTKPIAESVQAEGSQSRIAVTAMELFDEKPYLPSVSLTTQYKDMAIPMFFSHHVLTKAQASRGSYDYTRDILNSKDNKSSISPLTSIVKAVGLATYANIAKKPDILRSATMEYIHALRLTNLSLASPTEALKETVILSVILLSTFEAITCTGNKNLVAWNNHVKGSIQLLYLRGTRQFETEAGVAMWHLLTANIISSCIQRQCHVPVSLLNLRKHIKGSIDSNSFLWRSVEIMIRWVNLMADIKLRRIAGHEFVKSATAVDNEWLDHFSKPELPESLVFQCVYVNAPKELVYEDYYSAYSSWYAGSQWNHTRLCRIYLNQMIHNETRRLLHEERHILTSNKRYEMEETLRKSSGLLNQLGMEIASSIPQLMGYSSSLRLSAIPPRTRFSCVLEVSEAPSSQIGEPKTHDLPEANSNPRVHTSNHLPFNTTSAMGLLWPLYSIGSFDNYSLDLRKWVINRLEFIGHTQGIGQALMIARALRDRGHIRMYKSDVEDLLGSPSKKAVVEEEDVDADDKPGTEKERINIEVQDEFFFEADVHEFNL